jgi:hypothetical protein
VSVVRPRDPSARRRVPVCLRRGPAPGSPCAADVTLRRTGSAPGTGPRRRAGRCAPHRSRPVRAPIVAEHPVPALTRHGTPPACCSVRHGPDRLPAQSPDAVPPGRRRRACRVREGAGPSGAVPVTVRTASPPHTHRSAQHTDRTTRTAHRTHRWTRFRCVGRSGPAVRRTPGEPGRCPCHGAVTVAPGWPTRCRLVRLVGPPLPAGRHSPWRPPSTQRAEPCPVTRTGAGSGVARTPE